jgi:putative AlgH/UPF0301 family transcriptional regulator
MKNGTLKPSAGKILISEPFMMDSYFQRSVVLLTEHSQEGTIGFILNKQTTVMVCDVLQDFPESDPFKRILSISYTPFVKRSKAAVKFKKEFTGAEISNI